VTDIGKPPPHILGQVARGRTLAHWERETERLSIPASDPVREVIRWKSAIKEVEGVK